MLTFQQIDETANAEGMKPGMHAHGLWPGPDRCDPGRPGTGRKGGKPGTRVPEPFSWYVLPESASQYRNETLPVWLVM